MGFSWSRRLRGELTGVFFYFILHSSIEDARTLEEKGWIFQVSKFSKLVGRGLLLVEGAGLSEVWASAMGVPLHLGNSGVFHAYCHEWRLH